jgi:hypothetical protein
LYALKYKGQVQGLSDSPEYKRLHGKNSVEEQAYNLFQKHYSDSKQKPNNVSIKFHNPLEAIKESPMRAKAYSQTSDPNKIPSNLIASAKPSTPLQGGIKTGATPSFMTPLNPKPLENYILNSILTKANTVVSNQAYGTTNNQLISLKSGVPIYPPNNTLQSLSLSDKNEDLRNSFQPPDSSSTPMNNSSTGVGSMTSNEKSEDNSSGTNSSIYTNPNSKNIAPPRSPIKTGPRPGPQPNQNAYSPNLNKAKPGLNTSFTKDSKGSNQKVDDKTRKMQYIISQPIIYKVRCLLTSNNMIVLPRGRQ